MNIKTGNIQFNDMLILGKAFLDSLRIPNELAQFKAEGSATAETTGAEASRKRAKIKDFI